MFNAHFWFSRSKKSQEFYVSDFFSTILQDHKLHLTHINFLISNSNWIWKFKIYLYRQRWVPHFGDFGYQKSCLLTFPYSFRGSRIVWLLICLGRLSQVFSAPKVDKWLKQNFFWLLLTSERLLFKKLFWSYSGIV